MVDPFYSDEGTIPAEIVLCEHCGSRFNYAAMDWFGKLSVTLTCSSPKKHHPGWWEDENAVHTKAVMWFMEHGSRNATAGLKLPKTRKQG